MVSQGYESRLNKCNDFNANELFWTGRLRAPESEMGEEFRAKLNGDKSRKDASASFTLPFDTRDVWGRAKVPLKVTINGYTWRSMAGNRGVSSTSL